MAVFVDARIPVVFGADPGEHDALLVLDGKVAHPGGCACCQARSSNAAGLDPLFLDRVRGTMPWFTRVVVVGEDPALRQAIQTDPVLSARFRLG